MFIKKTKHKKLAYQKLLAIIRYFQQKLINKYLNIIQLFRLCYRAGYLAESVADADVVADVARRLLQQRQLQLQYYDDLNVAHSQTNAHYPRYSRQCDVSFF